MIANEPLAKKSFSTGKKIRREFHKFSRIPEGRFPFVLIRGIRVSSFLATNRSFREITDSPTVFSIF